MVANDGQSTNSMVKNSTVIIQHILMEFLDQVPELYSPATQVIPLQTKGHAHKSDLQTVQSSSGIKLKSCKALEFGVLIFGLDP